MKLARLWPYIVILLLVVPLILPLLGPGFFVSDDGEWMVIRLSAFHETLRTGQFPVRFLERLNHSYGYPVTNFLYPLPFYLGEVVHLLGFGFVDSIKILFGASFVLGAIFMYRFLALQWGILAGLVGAVLYSYAPYRIFDVYKRGSLGEAVAFVFVPLVFYFLEKVFATNKVKYVSLAALAYAALITSHNVMAFIFTPVILFYCGLKIWQTKDKTRLLILYSIFYLLSSMLSAWFWFPALYDLQFTRAATVQVSRFWEYFLRPSDIWTLIGIVPLVLVATSISRLIKVRGRDRDAVFWVTVSVVSLFLSVSLSRIVWEWLPLRRLVQFPWRFLAIFALSTGVLGGYLAKIFQGKQIVVVLLVLLAMVNGLLSVRIEKAYRGESFYSTNDDTTTVRGEYMSKWVGEDSKGAPSARLEILEGEGNVLSDGRVDMQTAGRVRVNTMYFPGHEVKVNGQRTSFGYEETGYIELPVFPGIQTVEVEFKETPGRLLADIISLIGIGSVALLLLI